MSRFFEEKSKQIWFRQSALSTLEALALLVIGLLFAQGARAQKITMEFDQSIDFSKYKTFAIRDGQLNSGNPALNSPLVKKQIEADITNDLTAKGLTLVTSGPSDLNVRYTFGAARKTEIEAYPAGWYGLGTRYVQSALRRGNAGHRSARPHNAFARLARHRRRRKK